MTNKWRLIETPSSDISSQMALDRELFEEFIQNPEAPPLLRIFRVSEPGVSVGHSWPLTPTLSPQGRGKGEGCPCIRPTGGGLVRHGNDLIYSVIARYESFPTFNRARVSYLSFHEVAQEAFAELGIETRLFRCDEAKSPAARHCEGAKRPKQSLFQRLLRPCHRLRRCQGLAMTECFREPIATDLMIGNQKIAGGAQRRKQNVFLHQGSIQLPKGISFEALKEVFVQAFERKFGVVWECIQAIN